MAVKTASADNTCAVTTPSACAWERVGPACTDRLLAERAAVCYPFYWTGLGAKKAGADVGAGLL